MKKKIALLLLTLVVSHSFLTAQKLFPSRKISAGNYTLDIGKQSYVDYNYVLDIIPSKSYFYVIGVFNQARLIGDSKSSYHISVFDSKLNLVKDISLELERKESVESIQHSGDDLLFFTSQEVTEEKTLSLYVHRFNAKSKTFENKKLLHSSSLGEKAVNQKFILDHPDGNNKIVIYDLNPIDETGKKSLILHTVDKNSGEVISSVNKELNYEADKISINNIDVDKKSGKIILYASEIVSDHKYTKVDVRNEEYTINSLVFLLDLKTSDVETHTLIENRNPNEYGVRFRHFDSGELAIIIMNESEDKNKKVYDGIEISKYSFENRKSELITKIDFDDSFYKLILSEKEYKQYAKSATYEFQQAKALNGDDEKLFIESAFIDEKNELNILIEKRGTFVTKDYTYKLFGNVVHYRISESGKIEISSFKKDQTVLAYLPSSLYSFAHFEYNDKNYYLYSESFKNFSEGVVVNTSHLEGVKPLQKVFGVSEVGSDGKIKKEAFISNKTNITVVPDICKNIGDGKYLLYSMFVYNKKVFCLMTLTID